MILDQWFPVTPEELAFLARVEPDDPVSPLEELTPIGAWLRHPEVQALGERFIERRAAELPDFDAETWSGVVLLAQVIGAPQRASVLSVEFADETGLHLITCVASVGTAQLAVTAQGMGIRPLRWPIEPADLERSLADSCAGRIAVTLRLISRSDHGEADGLVWDGQLLQEAGSGGVRSVATADWKEVLERSASFIADLRDEIA